MDFDMPNKKEREEKDMKRKMTVPKKQKEEDVEAKKVAKWLEQYVAGVEKFEFPKGTGVVVMAIAEKDGGKSTQITGAVKLNVSERDTIRVVERLANIQASIAKRLSEEFGDE